MKKIIIILMAILFTNTVCVRAEDMKIGAIGAVLIDADTKRVLWERKSDVPMAVASTTKIMTAILAIESQRLDETAVVTSKAASSPEVKLGLRSGEEYKLGDLLYPLMLQSSNDAAIVIAEHLGGSVDGFAQMMNDKAEELGAKNTKFVTPNGLDEDDNHSTAYDMALITAYALNNENFVKLINTKEYSFNCVNKSRNFTAYNKNRLLNEYDGAIGVKTGFTGKAGQCFVGAAERDGVRLISVVLGSGWGSAGKQQKWLDTKRLLNYGFGNYHMKQIISNGTEVGTVKILHSKEGEVMAQTCEDGFAMLNDEEKSSLKTSARLIECVEAPVKKGQVLGEITVRTSTGEVLFISELTAKEDVLRHDLRTSAKKTINLWLNS
ncbi:MAG: D-alanyl-D-alanine carboxypeptidase family protein [Anaerotignaceae bacterium]